MSRPILVASHAYRKARALGARRLTIAAVVGAGALCTLAACSTFTAGEAAALEGAYAAACPELSLIPVVGGLLGAACAGEEGNVKAALDHAVTTSGPQPDAGAPAPQAATVASAGVRLGAPLTARRRGRRRHVGRCPATFTPSMVAAAQAHLDATADGGA